MLSKLRLSSVVTLLLATGVQSAEVSEDACNWLGANVNWEGDDWYGSVKDKAEMKDRTEFEFWYAVNTCWYRSGGDRINGDGPTHGEICTFLGDNIDWDSADPYASSRSVEGLEDVTEQQLYGFATACYDIYIGSDGTDELAQACEWIGQNVDFDAEDVWATVKDNEVIKEHGVDEEELWFTSMMCWWKYDGGASPGEGEPSFKELCEMGQSWVTNPNDPWNDVKDKDELKDIREAHFIGIWEACKVYVGDPTGSKPVKSSDAGIFSSAGKRKPPAKDKNPDETETETAAEEEKAADPAASGDSAASALLASGMAILALSLF